MSYLSPYKVSLLLLVYQYCDSNVPSKDIYLFLKEISHCILNVLSRDLQGIEREQGLQDECASRLQVSADLKQDFLEHKCLQEILDLFLVKIHTIDSLHKIVTELERTFHSVYEGSLKQLESKSLLGLYVRSFVVEFEKLSFTCMNNLWVSFVQYASITSTRSSEVFKLSPLIIKQHFGPDMLPSGCENARSCSALSRASLLLDKSCNPYDHYFASCRSLDCVAAFDELHRHFDYAMDDSLRSDSYQDALFNLSQTHAIFGNYTEALFASQESIAVARENSDKPSMASVLLWQSALTYSQPEFQALDLNWGQIMDFVKSSDPDKNTHPDFHVLNDSPSHFLTMLSYLEDCKRQRSIMAPISTFFESLYKSLYLGIISRKGFSKLSAESQFYANKLQSNIWRSFGTEPLATLYAGFAYSQASSPAEKLELQIMECRSLIQTCDYQSATSLFANIESSIRSTPELLPRFSVIFALKIGVLIGQGRLADADTLLGSVPESLDMSLSHFYAYLRALLFFKEKKFESAKEIVDKELGQYNYESEINHELVFLILSLRISLVASKFTLGLKSLALRAFHLADRASLCDAKAECSVLLARIYLQEYSTRNEALLLLHGALPVIHTLGREDLYLEAQKYIAENT